MKVKKQLVATLSLAMLASVTMGVSVMTKTASAEAGYTWDNTKIAGVQLRLDDAGMRAVLQMDQTDYTEYTKAENTYTAGILYMPTLLVPDDGLKATTEYVAKAEFDDTYVAKKVGDVYHFNGVLKGIEEKNYAIDLTMVGYVFDGTNYEYTDPVQRTVGGAAEAYLGNEQVENQTAVKEYLYKYYNAAIAGTENDVANFDALVEKLNAETITMNDANAIMWDNSTTDNQLSYSVADLFNVDYEAFTKTTKYAIVENITYGEAPVTIDENGKVSAKANAESAPVEIRATALNGAVNATYDLMVVDETITTITEGKFINTDIHSFDGLGLATEFNMGVFAHYTQWGKFGTNNVKYANYVANVSSVDYAKGEDAKDGVDAVKMTGKSNAWTTANLTMQYRLEYTKKQVKMLLDQGYEKLIVPLYLEVSDEVLNGNRTFVVTNDEGTVTGQKNWLDVITLNKNATGWNDDLIYYHGYDASRFTADNHSIWDYQRLWANKWSNIEIPLQVVYDNYAQFTRFANTSNTYAEKMFPLFQVLFGGRGNGTGSFETTPFDMSMYFGNARVEKGAVISEEYIDLDGNDGYTFVSNNDYMLAQYATAANAPNIWQKYGRVGLVRGEVNGKTSGNGAFICLSNTQSHIMSYNEIASTNMTLPGNYPKWSADLGITLEQLNALKASGYKTLTMDVYVERTAGITTEVGEKVFSIFGVAATVDCDSGAWKTNAVSVSIDTLITYYDAYFVSKTNPVLAFGFSGGATNMNVYLGNLKFMK